MRRLLGCLILLSSMAAAQGTRYDNFVLKPLAAGGVTPVSGALITVCTSAGTGTPCTPKVANIYSDEALTTTITGTGGAGTTNSDANGNFGFYLAPGSYIVTVTGSGFTSYTIKLTLSPSGTVAALKYASGDAYMYVSPSGSDSNDGLSPGTAKLTVGAALTAVKLVGSGIVDARALQAATFTSQLAVGDPTNNPRITLLLPSNGVWKFNITDGVSCGIIVYNLSTLIGQGTGVGSAFSLQPFGA